MKKYSIVLVLILIAISCKMIYHTAPRYLKEKGFTFRYSDKASGLDKKLNIHGYYTINDTLNSNYIFGRYTNMMFFDDGMFVSGFHNCCDTAISHLGKVIPMYFDSIIKQRSNGERNYQFYENFIWGYYEVHGDIIKVQHIDRPVLGESRTMWYAYDIWFKIIDRNSIKEIYIYPIHEPTDSVWFTNLKKDWIPVKAYFKPLKEVPISDGWLKYEKWFWGDETKYIDWIDHNKK